MDNELDDDFADEIYGDEDFYGDGADNDRNLPCIGAACVSGVFDHNRDECVTVEMMEGWYQQGIAEEKR